MKVLVAVRKGENGGKTYVVTDPTTHKLMRMDDTGVVKWYKKNRKPFIDGLYYDSKNERVTITDEAKYTSGSVYLMSMLGEDRKAQGKKPKILGYKLYVPELDATKCYTVKEALDVVKEKGILNGEIRKYLDSEFIYAKAKVEPADKHAGLYLRMYHLRKERAQRKGIPCEKIVRVDESHLELRKIPAGTFDKLSTPTGVHYINLKYWQLIDRVRMEIKDHPMVENLTLADCVEEIKYNYPEHDFHLVPNGVSLGAFANWGIKELKLSPHLKVIGREAFCNNKIRSVTFPGTVEVIGESAFANNPIETIRFERPFTPRPQNGKFAKTAKPVKPSKPHAVRIERGAFKGTRLDPDILHHLPNIEHLGTDAFKGSTLGSIAFGRESTLKTIPNGAFANTNLSEFWVPDSVETITTGAFTGSPVNKVIFSKNSKIKTIQAGAFDSDVKIIGTRVRMSRGVTNKRR